MKNIFTLMLAMIVFCGMAVAQQHSILENSQGKGKTAVVEGTKQLPEAIYPSLSKNNTIFYEDFGGGMPSDWTVVTHSGPVTWEWTTTGGAYGGQLKSTTAANGYMIADSDKYGTGSQENTDLISPAIDCSGASGDIFFSVEHWARTYGYADISIYISTDDFSTQTRLYNWSGGAIDSYNGNNPVVSVFNITDIAAGKSNVKIKFNWKGSWDYWWLVDDVTIFEGVSFDLTMETPIGNGTVIPAPGVYNYTEGSLVNLSATPGFGFTFGGWNKGNVANPAAARTTITMDQDQVVQATFAGYDADLLWHQHTRGATVFQSAAYGTVNVEAADNFSNNSIGVISKVVVVGLSGFNQIWTPGETVPFKVRFYNQDSNTQPQWHSPYSEQTVQGKAFFVETVASYQFYKFELDLITAVNLKTGWVSVQSLEAGGDGFWYVNATAGDGDSKIWLKGSATATTGFDFRLELWGKEAEAVVPECVAYLSPTNGAVNIPLNASLSWIADPNATGYTLFFGETLPATGIDVGNVTTYQPALQYGTTYYWKVVPYNANGSPTDCPVWSFKTIEAYTVTFDVKDQGGSPITDAVVTFNGVTNAAGNYVFTDMAPGTYAYTVARAGYLDATGNATVVDANLTVTVTLTLKTYTVTFDIKDQVGNPITDAVVTLNGVTNAAGNYAFTDIAPGTYAYTVAKAGYLDATGNATVVDANLTVTVTLTLKTYTVTFDVKNEGGSPITDAVVTFNGVSNAAGNYVFTNIAPGTYAYTVTRAGYLDATGNATVVDANLTVSVTLTLKTYTVTFDVKNEGGNPITDAVVTFNGVSNAAGNYVFTNIAPGTYAYTVAKAGFFNKTGNAVVTDQDLTVNVAMQVDNTGIADQGLDKIRVFPVPARTTLYITSPELIRDLRIIDMVGQVVYTANVAGLEHEVNVSGLKNGIYFVRILTDRGIETRRIQVQK